MKFKQGFWFFSVLMIVNLGCGRTVQQADRPENSIAVIEERDLIPEGTAYDPVSELVFISSIYKRKIVAIRKDGTYFDFVKEAQYDLWSTLGMEVDTQHHKLWVISGRGKSGLPTQIEINDSTWYAKLYCFDIPSGGLDKIYTVRPEIESGFCFNDLTITGNGNVFLTESIQNKIYILRSGDAYIELFLEPKGYTFLNGITHTADDKTLFASSTEGILSIDIESAEFNVLYYAQSTEPNPIDGLAYYDHSLIGHQSNVLTRFFLNERLDSITHHQHLDSLSLDSSTTGEIGKDGWYYYIGNAQIRSGVNYKNMTILPWDSLEPIVIKKLKL